LEAQKKATAREVAFKALGLYRRDKAWSESALSGLLRGADLSRPDAALSTQILFGVLQNMALCDYYTAYYSTIDLRKLEPRVLDILRLSIYQIVFLMKIPNSAAVNEAVTLTKKYSNQNASGFVNALLRKIATAADAGALPEIAGDPLHQLAVKYSHPDWLVREFCETLGREGAEALLAANNSEDTPITVQVNTLLANVYETLRLLSADDVEAVRHEWLDDCINMRGTGNILRLEAFCKGYIYVQDAAAKLAVIAAGPKKGDYVIDGCAAPGGKSFAAAIAMEGAGRIDARDIHAAKLRNLQSGAERLKIKIIDTMKKDASAPPDELSGKADVVLADVPCSGFGAIRKKPEIRYKTREEIEDLPDIQGKILSALSDCVKPGGVLLYSTCTILRCENEDVVDRFLEEDGRFELEAFTLPHIGRVESGMITLWPHIHGTDGFFICKLRRNSQQSAASGRRSVSGNRQSAIGRRPALEEDDGYETRH